MSAERSMHIRLPVETLESLRALCHAHGGSDVARYTRRLIEDTVHGKAHRFGAAKLALSAPQKEMVASHVYVIKCGRLYKIGKSNEPGKRVRAMQLPHAAAIVATFPTSDPHALERQLHARFASKRTRGEWFRLSAGDVLDLQGGKGK